MLFISLPGMAFGAKSFGFLTGIYRNIGIGNSITLGTLLDTGIVFYGGLFGLLISYSLCLKSNHCTLNRQALDVLAVCIPLFHSIARIGCFLSGCCYGRLYQGVLSIKYSTRINGYVDINLRFPVQLVESLFEFIVFVYLFTLLRNENWQSKKIMLRYLFTYSIGRFWLEFLRGDIRRGLIYGVSFSQFISVLIWIALIGYYLSRRMALIGKREDYNG